MNRTDICKNIIQSIKEYITNSDKLEANREMNQRAAAIEHLKSLEALNIYQNSVIIFDRRYYSEKLFRYCVEHEHTCLMRLKNNYNIAKKCSGDICTILHGQSKDGTKDIDIRVIEITLPDGKKEYLATNLFDKSITQEIFSELYFYRWPVETKYREFKSRLILICFVLTIYLSKS